MFFTKDLKFHPLDGIDVPGYSNSILTNEIIWGWISLPGELTCYVLTFTAVAIPFQSSSKLWGLSAPSPPYKMLDLNFYLSNPARIAITLPIFSLSSSRLEKTQSYGEI